MDSQQVNPTGSDQQVAVLEQKLEETTQQLRHKDAEHKELLKKYRQKKRDLLDMEDKINDLKNDVKDLDKRNHRKKRELRDKDDQIDALKRQIRQLEAQPHQRTIDDVNNHNRCLQSYVQTLLKMNEKLQQGYASGSLEGKPEVRAGPSNQTPKGQASTKPFSKQEDNCLIDFLFNSTPEVRNLGGDDVWNRANEAILEVAGNHRTIQSLRKRLKALTSKLHLREDLTTDKHRRIASLCYESSFRDRRKAGQYMAMYDQTRRSGFSIPMSQEEREIDQMIHYIFNVNQPSSFTDTYWETLSNQLENDIVISQSVDALAFRECFQDKIMFSLYKKNKQLWTEEHRRIAVMAFETYGRKLTDELIKQYDLARLPDITEQQIAQMKNMASQRD